MRVAARNATESRIYKRYFVKFDIIRSRSANTIRSGAMIPVNVTLQFMRDGVKGSATMRLSMDVTAAEAANGIVHYLGLPTDGEYRLLRQRQLLDPDKRLFEAGVQEGDILQLTVVDANTTLAMPGLGRSLAGGVLSRLGGRTSDEPLP